jgi:hypothetical protein
VTTPRGSTPREPQPETTTMKTAIIRFFNEWNIKIGQPISNIALSAIRRELAGDSPAKWEKFYAAWYQVTDDGPGNGTYPNLPVRTK